MKLKRKVNLVDFLLSAKQCEGEVFYKTEEGDILNLKSQLSQYIFLAALGSAHTSPLPDGMIVCQIPTDYEILSEYLSPRD